MKRTLDADIARFGLVAAALALLVATGACIAADNGLLPEPPGSGAIPARPVVKTLVAQAAYDSSRLWLRLRFDANQGQLDRAFHYVNGAWVEEGGGFRDLDASLSKDPARGATDHVSAWHEVELGVAISARTPTAAFHVRDFDKFGCFPACHERQRQMPNWRESDGPAPMWMWPSYGPADLWVWRAQRTGFAGLADDLTLTENGLVPDPGRAGWTDLALGADGNPPLVFASSAMGGAFTASWDAMRGGSAPIAMSDGRVAGLPAAMSSADAIGAGWSPAEGDAVPAQVLTLSTGSRADVSAASSWANGSWDLTLSRALNTGDAAHDVAFVPGATYDLGFSLHSDQADGRDHYVSLPIPIALVVSSAGNGIRATPISGGGPPDFSDETTYPPFDVALFLPGITSIDFTVGAVTNRDGSQRRHDIVHGGHVEVAESRNACGECHRVRVADPPATHDDVGPFQELVLWRGGVFGPTPFFGDAP